MQVADVSLPTDSISLPVSLDGLGLSAWVIPAAVCVFVILVIRRAMKRPHKYSLVAEQLGLVYSREGIGSATAWGTLADGRKVHVYTKTKKRGPLDMILRAFAGWWSFSRVTENIEVGIEGFASGDIRDDDRPLFREYAHRALTDAYARHQAQLVPLGIYNLVFDRDTIRARDVRVRCGAVEFVAGIEAIVEVARQLEQAAMTELARVRYRGMSDEASQDDTASPEPEAVSGETDVQHDEVVPEAVVCPHCEARTPTERGRCQMCGRPLDAPAETSEPEWAEEVESAAEAEE